MPKISYLLLTVCAFYLALFSSCSNDSDGSGGPGVGDSSWVVSTVKRVGIEIDNGVMADTAWDSYSYLPGKIIHKSIYTSGYSPVVYDSLQYSYYYDGQGILLRYENDYISDRSAFVYEIEKMEVNYSGDKISSVSWEDFDGNLSLHQFEYSADMRRLTIYDTLNSDPNAQNQKWTYYLNADKSVDSTVFSWNNLGGGGIVYLDTLYGKYIYDIPGNLVKYIEHDYNTFLQQFSISTSEVMLRETRGSEIGKTLKKVRSTLDFYHVMHLESNDALTFFDNSIPAAHIYSPFAPVTIRESRNTDPALTGTVINVFDSRNLLIEQTFPDGFGSKREGPSKLTFTYTRIPN